MRGTNARTPWTTPITLTLSVQSQSATDPSHARKRSVAAVAALARDRRLGGGERLLLHVGQDQPHAFVGEPTRGGQSDATGRSRHDGHSTSDVVHFDPPSLDRD